MGLPVKHPAGFEVKIKGRPLDFHGVTDHSEYAGVIQLAVPRFVFCCSAKLAADNGHETLTVLDEVRATISNGEPGVCTATNDQNPPFIVEFPLANGPPASCWPMVPLTTYCPLLLVPPPPATLYQSME